MTAHASIPALIAEGRRLIAEATYDSAEPWQFERNEEPDEVYYRDGTFDVIGSGLMANAAYPENETRARLAVLAVNAFPALIDVAEAAKRALEGFPLYADPMTPEELGVDGRYVRLTVGDVRRLRRALAALALGPDDDGKEKGK